MSGVKKNLCKQVGLWLFFACCPLSVFAEYDFHAKSHLWVINNLSTPLMYKGLKLESPEGVSSWFAQIFPDNVIIPEWRQYEQGAYLGIIDSWFSSSAPVSEKAAQRQRLTLSFAVTENSTVASGCPIQRIIIDISPKNVVLLQTEDVSQISCSNRPKLSCSSSKGRSLFFAERQCTLSFGEVALGSTEEMPENPEVAVLENEYTRDQIRERRQSRLKRIETHVSVNQDHKPNGK